MHGRQYVFIHKILNEKICMVDNMHNNYTVGALHTAARVKKTSNNKPLWQYRVYQLCSMQL